MLRLVWTVTHAPFISNAAEKYFATHVPKQASQHHPRKIDEGAAYDLFLNELGKSGDRNFQLRKYLCTET